MLYEFSIAILFYAVFSLFGAIGIAATLRWMPGFKSAYISAKLFGLLLFGYFIWLSSSFKILNFQNIFVVRSLFIIFAVAGIWLAVKNWPRDWKKTYLKDLMWTEAIWLFLYLFYLWLRNGEIHGTERFMDMAFFNASSLTDYFPPTDPWRAGSPINYYYFGHYLFALVANLAGSATNYAYNFTLGIIYSSALMLSWSFVRRFVRSNLFASLSAFFVVASGTVAYSFCVMGAPAGSICSYMKSTRLYEPSYIINEIPSYSFTVGDLHAHLLALPFFILALIIIYDVFKTPVLSYGLMGALALILGSAGMINPWDFVSLTVVIGVSLLLKIIRQKQFDWMLIGKTAIIGGSALILMLPFLWNFESGAAGIGFAPAYAQQNNLGGKQYPTPMHGWLGMWAAFLSISAIAFYALRKKMQNVETYLPALFFSCLVLLAGVELFFVRDLYSLANPPYFRANTVFKFGFHTWIILSLLSMILAAKTFEEYNRRGTSNKPKFALSALGLIVAISAFLGLYYPFQAVSQFSSFTATPPYTLDGSFFLKRLYPADYEAVQWLKKNMNGREVVVEAAGESYSDYGRISVFSGSISPVNWLSHEWTWHFRPEPGKKLRPGVPQETGWGEVAGLSGNVRTIYETADSEQAKILLKKFSAKYVYIGDLERQMYTSLIEQKFTALGEIVFQSGNSKLYKLKY